ncbi:MAG: hypothetical protein JSC188_000447 [Candidatus Tokpelaia sp. JSC188]|nr:MAG: hypothetical protein JSC188_000447 [Candidatus Tokpelaia sp. JSC188]
MHRTARLELKLTSVEKAALVSKASNAGVSLSRFVREAVAGEGLWKGKVRRIEVSPLLIRSLAQIGNNLNQLARWANRDKSGVDALAINARLIEIDRELHALRHQHMPSCGLSDAD